MTPTVDHTAYRSARIVWTLLLASLVALYVVVRLQLAEGGTPTVSNGTSQRNTFLALSAGVIVAIVLADRGMIPVQPRRGASVAFVRHVMCWALAESIGLYGVILAFQTREIDEAHLFMLVAGGLLFWLRPRPERFPPDRLRPARAPSS